MRLTVTRKLFIGLLGVMVLAFVGSGLAFLSASHSAEVLEDLVARNLEQSRSIYELQIALLKQGGLTSSYLLDGDPEWLEELTRQERVFGEWLSRVSVSGVDPHQEDYVSRIKTEFREYDAVRDKAVELYDAGRMEEAHRLLLEEINTHYDRVNSLCEALSLANDADIDAILSARQVQTHQMGIWIIVCLTSLALLIVGLVWTISAGVLGPLRRITDEARQYIAKSEHPPPPGELDAVDTYLKTLRLEVDQAKTRLAQSNRHLLNAEQMASIGRIAAGVAHEIRSPLTSLRLRLFSMQKSLGNHHESDFAVITEEVTRLDGIIRNFLEFSRPPDLRLQPCNISMVLDKTLELVRYKIELLGVDIERQEEIPLPAVLADSHQLRQVFLNLFNNALDVMPEGGRIEVTATEKTMPSGRAVVVRIKDHGPGIPAGAVERVFDPFFSTKQDGAGLGLWIARRIITQHGGSLDLVASTESGTTFSIAIPIAGKDDNEHHPGR